MLKPLLKNTARPFLALKKTNHRYSNLFRKRGLGPMLHQGDLICQRELKGSDVHGSNFKTFHERSKSSYLPKKVSLCVYTLPRNELLCQLFGGHRQQWISHKIDIRHSGQLKKSKSWWPFWSYQLMSTANLAHIPRNRVKWAELLVLLDPKWPPEF